MFRGGRYSEVPPIKLVLIWDVWGLGCPLLMGGHCSEVVVNTGLTVLSFFSIIIKGTTNGVPIIHEPYL